MKFTTGLVRTGALFAILGTLALSGCSSTGSSSNAGTAGKAADPAQKLRASLISTSRRRQPAPAKSI
ncbi:MAG: hypothetical protein R3D29_02940 [Nitratireductor sp.]